MDAHSEGVTGSHASTATGGGATEAKCSGEGAVTAEPDSGATSRDLSQAPEAASDTGQPPCAPSAKLKAAARRKCGRMQSVRHGKENKPQTSRPRGVLSSTAQTALGEKPQGRPTKPLKDGGLAAPRRPALAPSPSFRPSPVKYGPLTGNFSAPTIQAGKVKPKPVSRAALSPCPGPPSSTANKTLRRSSSLSALLKCKAQADPARPFRAPPASLRRPLVPLTAARSEEDAAMAEEAGPKCTPGPTGPRLPAASTHAEPSDKRSEVGPALLRGPAPVGGVGGFAKPPSSKRPEEQEHSRNLLPRDTKPEAKPPTSRNPQVATPSKPPEIPKALGCIQNQRLAELEQELRAQLQIRKVVEDKREQLVKVLHNATAKTAEIEKMMTDEEAALESLRSESRFAQMDEDAARRRRIRVQYITRRMEAELADARIALKEKQEALLNIVHQRRDILRKAIDQKGRIRVFCRIRPFLHGETRPSSPAVRCPDGCTVEVTRRDLKRHRLCRFKLDKAFGATASQAEVYAELVVLVQSAVDGHEVCVFAYGQTGSGKTHTMEGPAAAGGEEDRGVIPRALEHVWACTQRQPHCSYEIRASVVEVYNEEVYDVLCDAGEGQPCARRRLKIGDEEGGIVVRDLTQLAISSGSQVAELVEVARQKRATAATALNYRSSRSHLLYQIEISGCQGGERTKGHLTLVDLAGSEDLSEAGEDEARQREGASIRTSLLGLEAVFLELSAGKEGQYVPFRRCKLTHILRDSFMPGGTILVVVNISPRDEDLPETMKSLRFASTVNKKRRKRH